MHSSARSKKGLPLLVFSSLSLVPFLVVSSLDDPFYTGLFNVNHLSLRPFN